MNRPWPLPYEDKFQKLRGYSLTRNLLTDHDPNVTQVEYDTSRCTGNEGFKHRFLYKHRIRNEQHKSNELNPREINHDNEEVDTSGTENPNRRRHQAL